jgi:hypothetical protein
MEVPLKAGGILEFAWIEFILAQMCLYNAARFDRQVRDKSYAAHLSSVMYFLGVFAGQWPSRNERSGFSHKRDIRIPYRFDRFYIQAHFRCFAPVTSPVTLLKSSRDPEGLECLREDILIASDALKVLPHLFQERRISIFGVLSSNGQPGMPAFYRILVLTEANMIFPFEVANFEASGLKWCGNLEGTIAFHAAVFASVGPWETDWDNVLDQIDDCLRLELKKDLTSDEIKKWMFDNNFERSKLYFTILQILRIFGEYIRTMAADLHHLDNLFMAGNRGFPLNKMGQDELHVMRSNWELVFKAQKAAEKRLLDRLSDKTEEVKSLRDGV